MSGKLFQICCLLLGFLSSMSDAQASKETQTLVTPKGISVLFWEMPQASTVSLAIGFKHGGLHNYPRCALLARMMQKSVEQLINTDASVPFKKLEFGEPFFDRKCFNLHLESNAAQLEEVLNFIMKNLQLEFVNAKQFAVARRSMLKEFQRKERPSQEKIELETKSPEIFVKFEMEEFENFVEYQLHRQLGNLYFNRAQFLTLAKHLHWQGLTDYAARYFTRDHLILGVAGSIQPEVLLRAIDNTLGQLPNQASVSSKDNNPLAWVKPPKLPKKQFFYQKDKRIPNIIGFGFPLPASIDFIQIDRYAYSPLLSLLQDMLSFYSAQETDDLNPFFRMDSLWIDIKKERPYLAGCFSATNKTAAKRVAKLKQFFKEFKEKGADTAWLPQYLAQLKQNNTIEKFRKEWIENVEDPILMKEVRSRPEYAAYYLLNRQAEVFARFPPNPSEYIAYLKKVQIEDLIPLVQAVLNPDQLVFTEVGHENHLD